MNAPDRFYHVKELNMTDAFAGNIADKKLKMVTVAVLLLVSCLLNRTVSQDIKIWAAGCTEKIQDQNRAKLKHDCVWAAESKTVRLTAVRGEHLPFQLVITTTEKEVSGIRVEHSPLKSPTHARSLNSIELYLVHLVNVYAATDDRGRRGRWPDALVPLTRPFDMRFFWHSQKINHQSIWVDIQVPRDLPAGEYRGTVTVSDNKKVLDKINVFLRVHDVTLPKQRSFPVHIGLYEQHIARMHGVKVGSEKFKTILNNYLLFFLENRIDPRTSPGFTGSVHNDRYVLNWNRPDLENLFLENGRLQFFVSPVPNGIQRQAGNQPFKANYRKYIRQHVTQVIDHAKQRGWYDRLGFHVPVDEPNSLQDYEAVRRWAEVIRSVDSKIAISVTEQPQAEKPEWGSLVGHVNTWIINGNYLFTQKESVETRRRAGDQMLWYISCDQLHPQPNFYIDREAADPRMVAWVSWRHRMSGLLYWNAAYWGEIQDPWLDPVTWKTIPCNLPAAGEGSLIYPGNMVKKYTGQENVDGPVNSMRLALLREGLEELELIQMLAELGGRKAADEIVSSICRNIRDFSRDPNEIDQTRERIIQQIIKLKK